MFLLLFPRTEGFRLSVGCLTGGQAAGATCSGQQVRLDRWVLTGEYGKVTYKMEILTNHLWTSPIYATLISMDFISSHMAANVYLIYTQYLTTLLFTTQWRLCSAVREDLLHEVHLRRGKSGFRGKRSTLPWCASLFSKGNQATSCGQGLCSVAYQVTAFSATRFCLSCVSGPHS